MATTACDGTGDRVSCFYVIVAHCRAERMEQSRLSTVMAGRAGVISPAVKSQIAGTRPAMTKKERTRLPKPFWRHEPSCDQRRRTVDNVTKLPRLLPARGHSPSHRT